MTTSQDRTDAMVSTAWRAHRPYLVDLAFATLRDIGAAEDAVQEAFTRLTNARTDQIEEVRGWLIVVTSRICLDQINSARSRRELAHDSSTVEFAGPAAHPSAPIDPADRATLDDEVRLALLVMLQELKPAERVVFVLHDIFALPFVAISETVGRSAPSCRQLSRRARLKIQGRAAATGSGVELPTPGHRSVVERFVQACSTGDIAGLVAVLDPQVSGDADLGPFDRRTGKVTRGPRAVAQGVLRWLGPGTTMVSNPVGGRAVLLAFAGRQFNAVALVDIEGELIKKIHVIADPGQIGPLSDQLSADNGPARQG